ncbi:MAG: sugar transferase [Gaiellaceae bacterium]
MTELHEGDIGGTGGRSSSRVRGRLRRLAVPQRPVAKRGAAPQRTSARSPIAPALSARRAGGRLGKAQAVLAGADVLALLVSVLVARLLGGESFLVPALVVGTWPAIAYVARLYEVGGVRAHGLSAGEVGRLLRLLTLLTWGALLVAVVLGFGDDLRDAAVFWTAGLATLTAGRIGSRVVISRTFASGQNTVIVGAGTVGQLIARKILQHPEYGIEVVGFVDAQPKKRRSDLRDLTLLGTPEELPQIVQTYDVERIIVAFSNDTTERVIELIRSITKPSLQIDVVPRLFELMGPSTQIHALEGLPLVEISSAIVSPTTLRIKRAVDIVGASLALMFLSPLFALIALRIRRDSPGPIFFRQVRLGQGMREFTSLKFRTMKTETQDVQHRDYIRSMMTEPVSLESNGLFKPQRDDVVTKVGRWLRSSSVDELPQLLNVLRGDMSLVGPRPCIPYEVEFFEPHHFVRFQVPAGLTGLWQVTARARSTFAEALDMDVLYVRSFSIALDFRLILRTPGQLLNRGVTS